jgi:hypothetical protein
MLPGWAYEPDRYLDRERILGLMGELDDELAQRGVRTVTPVGCEQERSDG